MEERKFSKDQITILGACFLIYFCAYIGRLNLSASLDSIMNAFSIEETLGGTLQTVFAVVYATGQFVNGSLVDRFEPKKMILTGLIGSALCNSLFFVSNTFFMLCAAWALNGAFQSMLWTPIVRYLAAFFKGERRRRASFTMSFTLAGGHIAAWGLAILMQKIFGWRYAFQDFMSLNHCRNNSRTPLGDYSDIVPGLIHLMRSGEFYSMTSQGVT